MYKENRDTRHTPGQVATKPSTPPMERIPRQLGQLSHVAKAALSGTPPNKSHTNDTSGTSIGPDASPRINTTPHPSPTCTPVAVSRSHNQLSISIPLPHTITPLLAPRSWKEHIKTRPPWEQLFLMKVKYPTNKPSQQRLQPHRRYRYSPSVMGASNHHTAPSAGKLNKTK